MESFSLVMKESLRPQVWYGSPWGMEYITPRCLRCHNYGISAKKNCTQRVEPGPKRNVLQAENPEAQNYLSFLTLDVSLWDLVGSGVCPARFLPCFGSGFPHHASCSSLLE